MIRAEVSKRPLRRSTSCTIRYNFQIFDYGFDVVPPPTEGKVLGIHFILHSPEFQNFVCAAATVEQLRKKSLLGSITPRSQSRPIYPSVTISHRVKRS